MEHVGYVAFLYFILCRHVDIYFVYECNMVGLYNCRESPTEKPHYNFLGIFLETKIQ